MKKSEKWMAAVVGVLLLLSVESLLQHETHWQLGFYTWFSGLSCLLMVVIALLLGRLLRRRSDYYDRRKS